MPAQTMTEAECRAALQAHIASETTRDLDAIMATVTDDCFYIIPGHELRGKAAVRALYAASLDRLTRENADEYLRALDDPAVATWGRQHVVLAYTRDYPLHYGMFVVAHFARGKVRSEHTFVSNHPAGTASPFAGIPGVTVIG